MSVGPEDLAIDKELSQIAGSLAFLLHVTPVNVTDQRNAFFAGSQPRFEYKPLPDLEQLRVRLAKVNVEAGGDVGVQQMAAGLKRELELRLEMLADRGTDRFFLGSVELYGHVEPSLLELALALLGVVPDDVPTQTVSAHEFAERARAEIARYRNVFPELSATVTVSDEAAGVMVENGNLLVGSDTRIDLAHVEALLHHEIGVHVLTYANGSAQPLHMLATGLAGYDENQEALGVLAEHLSSGIPIRRLHTLAFRVVAAQRRSEGATFRETYDRLVELGSSRRKAFTTTMRAYRAGGMTKDAIYLRGLVKLCDYLADDGQLDGLFIGKVALAHGPVIEDLRQRDVLVEPPLRPRFLDNALAQRRLLEIRRGAGVHHLGGIAP